MINTLRSRAECLLIAAWHMLTNSEFKNPIMSLIQCEFTIDLPCEMGSAWNTPVGR